MEHNYEVVETLFHWLGQYAILIIELIGVLVLLFAIIRAVVFLFRKKSNVRLTLAEGISLALEFKMGSELLRTLIVREWSELLILGAIILIRAALSLLLHWEIRNERGKDSVEKNQAAVKSEPER